MAAKRRLKLATSNRASEKLASILTATSALIVAAALFFILGDVFAKGLGGLNFEFLTEETSDAGRGGGIFPIIVSTVSILAIAIAVALPLGLGTAIYLSEFSRRNPFTAQVVRNSLDVLAATPSIVFGLFGNAIFCRMMGLGYCLLAGGLTLACMVLPIMIRTLEVSLRRVPDDYRFAASSLGLSRTRLTLSILLPCALPGLIVGIVLGVGRVLAETAALLFTSGYVDRMPGSWLDSGRTLSIHIYDLSMIVTGGEPNAYKTAVVLIGLLLLINGTTLMIVQTWKRRLR